MMMMTRLSSLHYRPHNDITSHKWLHRKGTWKSLCKPICPVRNWPTFESTAQMNDHLAQKSRGGWVFFGREGDITRKVFAAFCANAFGAASQHSSLNKTFGSPLLAEEQQAAANELAFVAKLFHCKRSVWHLIAPIHKAFVTYKIELMSKQCNCLGTANVLTIAGGCGD